MFVLHNVTSHRVSLTLLPVEKAAEGTPTWRAKRFVRQRTVHVVVEPHLSVDLSTHGYSEADALAQSSVLEALRLGHLRRVKNEGGGYAEHQFSKQEVVTQPDLSSITAPVAAQPDLSASSEDIVEPSVEPVEMESAQEVDTSLVDIISVEPDAETSENVVRTPIVLKKKKR